MLTTQYTSRENQNTVQTFFKYQKIQRAWKLSSKEAHLTPDTIFSISFVCKKMKWQNVCQALKPENGKYIFSGNLSHSGKRNRPNNNRTIKKAPSNHNFLLFKTTCFLPSETKFIFSQLRAKSQIYFTKSVERRWAPFHCSLSENYKNVCASIKVWHRAIQVSGYNVTFTWCQVLLYKRSLTCII